MASSQVEHEQIYPEHQPGWHEHDPIVIWQNTKHCINALHKELLSKEGFSFEEYVKGIGITNQRETTIVWNAKTGLPYYNAIVWDDLRTADIIASIENDNSSKNDDESYTESKDKLRSKTGLPLATYFAGSKVRWLIENVDTLRKDLQSNENAKDVRFGTIDAWLIYQLTGSSSSEEGNVGGLFITDVTNASRWMFMNINTLKWDDDLIKTILGDDCYKDFPPMDSALPEIKSSSEIYGYCSMHNTLDVIKGIPMCAILGDQQAALFGQAGYHTGNAKCTYGTGVFLLMNTGIKCIPSHHGLLSTVAYQLGSGGDVVYALEGSVSHSGSTIQWLRDQLQIITKASESEVCASKVSSNDGLYFVPAFSGLFAPYWRSDARGCIVGMTSMHTKNHVCRAALEATCYQIRDLMDAIYKDSKISLEILKVDGGGSVNKLMMQFQADMVNVDVVRPAVMETTALGAAFAAGLAVGVWKSLQEIQDLWASDLIFKPTMDSTKRNQFQKEWKKAVGKSLNWVD